jgi:hypothetical protein
MIKALADRSFRRLQYDFKTLSVLNGYHLVPQPAFYSPIGIYSFPNGTGQRHGIYGDLGCIDCRESYLRIELGLTLCGRPRSKVVLKVAAKVCITSSFA